MGRGARETEHLGGILVGAIATTGDPPVGSGSALGGLDFTYATSRFRGNKNLRVGVGHVTRREDLGGERGLQRPNDRVPERQVGRRFNYKRIGAQLRSIAGVRAASCRAALLPMQNRTRIARGPSSS